MSEPMEQGNPAPSPEGSTAAVDDAPSPEGTTAAVDDAPSPEGSTAAVDDAPSPEGSTAAVDDAPSPEGSTAVVDDAPSPEGSTAAVDDAPEDDVTEDKNTTSEPKDDTSTNTSSNKGDTDILQDQQEPEDSDSLQGAKATPSDVGSDRDESFEGSDGDRSTDQVIDTSPVRTPRKGQGSVAGTPEKPGNHEGGSGGEESPPGGSPVPDQYEGGITDEDQVKDRLLQDPVDREVEAGEVDIDSARNGEVQNRTGRVIKKRDTYSPEHDTYRRKKIGRPTKFKIRRSGSFSDTADGSLSPSSFGIPRSPGVKLNKRAEVKALWLQPFAEGWRREIVLRNTYDEDKKRAADVYYYPPNKGKLRSSVQIGKYLEMTGNITLSTDCFTFIKETIHEEPQEYVRVAGRMSFGRAKGSPSKSPKTAVMKQKKSPFAKSPLLLKKTALGLTASPTSSKATPILVRMLPKIASPNASAGDMKPKFIIINKQAADSPNTSTVRTMGSVSIVRPQTAVTTTPSPTPHYIKVIPSTVGLIPRRPVAKKHTGKRSITSSDDNPATKKIKVVVPLSEAESQRLCDMDCPGRHGVPPSLHCTVCMCMFHPECVNRGLHQQRLDGFICRACRAVQKKINNTKSVNNNSIRGSSTDLSSLTPRMAGPPPLQMSLPMSVPVWPSGPPPLKVGPVGITTSSARQPPPLRMAPPTGLTTVMAAMPPPPLRAAGPAIGRSIIPDHHRIPLPVLNQPAVSIASATRNAPVPDVSLIPRVTGLPPIQVSMPTSIPKDISGQILALPTNVTSKLNMDKPVALKVNGQRYLIPPHCFINTQEGAKIYLPPGYLPSSVVQGPASPLSVNLNSHPGKDEQLLNITPLGDLADKVMETASSSTSPDGNTAKQRARPQRKMATPKNHCHIQQLHLGFDCMLHLFSYLGLKDLLNTRAVCKTWRRVASQHWMWKTIQLRGYRVTDWEKATQTFRDLHTHTLDLRGLHHGEDLNRTWHQFTGILPNLLYMRRVDFGQCPSTVLHAVTEKLTGLVALTAEFITDTTQEQQMWTSNAKLDIGKFCGLKDLEVLKLRGLCGLTMPAFSFSGGLSELGSLTKLRMLSLTTLRDVSEDEFHFLSTLTNLEELELGDLSSWKSETYDQLSLLTNLTSLRLECGMDYPEGGLGDALPNLSKLKNLELIKFAMSGSLMKSLVKVESIETISIWPDTDHQAALVNTCTLRAVSEMTSLKQLDWGIMIDTSAPTSTPATSNNGDDASQDSNSSGSSGPTVSNKQPADCVPILSGSVDVIVSPSKLAQLSKEENVEHLSINQLVDRLGNHLPDTKIRVFKVPIVTPKVAAAKQSCGVTIGC